MAPVTSPCGLRCANVTKPSFAVGKKESSHIARTSCQPARGRVAREVSDSGTGGATASHVEREVSCCGQPAVNLDPAFTCRPREAGSLYFVFLTFVGAQSAPPCLSTMRSRETRPLPPQLQVWHWPLSHAGLEELVPSRGLVQLD